MDTSLLDFMETNDVKHEELKGKTKKECIGRVKKYTKVKAK